jgi:hypothetical protein
MGMCVMAFGVGYFFDFGSDLAILAYRFCQFFCIIHSFPGNSNNLIMTL